MWPLRFHTAAELPPASAVTSGVPPAPSSVFAATKRGAAPAGAAGGVRGEKAGRGARGGGKARQYEGRREDGAEEFPPEGHRRDYLAGNGRAQPGARTATSPRSPGCLPSTRRWLGRCTSSS